MRVLATAAFSYSGAVLLAHYLLPEPLLPYMAVICIAAAALGLAFKGAVRARILLIALGLCLGFIWSWGFSAIYMAPAERLNGTTAEVTARAAGYSEPTDYGARVNARVETAGADVLTTVFFFDEQPEIAPGDTLVFTAEFTLPSEAMGGGGDAFTSKGVLLFAGAEAGCAVTKNGFSLRYAPSYAAGAVKNIIKTIFPESVRAFMLALLTGDRSLLNGDPLLSESLSKTGIAHIVAVSGMHLTFVMQFVGLFSGRKKRLLAALGIPATLLFMAVTGFSPSVSRAGVMQLFVLAAPVFKRENDPPTSLAAALALLLLVNPYSVGSVSLQLSFAACAGMQLITGRLSSMLGSRLRASRAGKIKPLARLLRFIIAGFSTTLGAMAFTVPLSAIHFGSVSLIAPVMNLAVIWAVSVAFTVGAVACCLGLVFAPVGAVAAAVAAVAAKYVILLAKWAAGLGVSAVYTSNVYVLIWLVYVYIMLAVFFAFKPKPRQAVLPACLAAVSLCAVLLISRTGGVSGGEMTVTVLDVGQGLSCVVRSGSATAVVDCGSSSGEDAGRIAADNIYSTGGDVIDMLVLTHYHDDHTNGAEKLIARCGVRTLAIPEPAEEDEETARELRSLAEAVGAEVIYVTRELDVTLGESHLLLFPPLGESDNERGVIILASSGESDVLITGDAGSANEKRLISAYSLPTVETLVVGHHGSKYSTCTELLYAIKPETAVISVGENSYGHPAEELLDRLYTYGITVYRTDEDGSVTVSAG